MSNKKKIVAAVAAAIAVFVPLAVTPASAHVSVYVAGSSGLAVNTDAANATYVVSFAPGHGCSGPRTAANPDGAYDTTSVEVFLPRTDTGKFILPEVRAVNKGEYRATMKTVVDPTDATKKRVNSIVFDNFVLPAVNGYAARDTIMLDIAVKLPTFAALKAAGYTVAAGTTSTALGAKIYFPTMQYCDVTGQGVGKLAATSTPAAATATVDPACNANDVVQTTLYDDWQTDGNTPSLTIGTALGTTAVPSLEFTGNKPTKAAETAAAYCSVAGGVNTRGLALQGNFAARIVKNKGIRVVVDAPVTSRNSAITISTADGLVVGKGKLDERGDFIGTLTKTSAKKVVAGNSLRLYEGTTLVAAAIVS